MRLVGGTEFERLTGNSRKTFYRWLSEMKKLGLISRKDKMIDMDNQWVINKLSTSGATNQRPLKKTHKKIVDASNKINRKKKKTTETTDEKLPDASKLIIIEQVEKIRKLQIDNAIKARKVISKTLVRRMIDKIDEANHRIIMDGRASFVPRVYEKIKAGCTCNNGCSIEEAQQFWHEEIGEYLKPVLPFLADIIKRDDEKIEDSTE